MKRTRIVWVSWMFVGIVFRTLPDGTRMGVRHAWRVACV